VWTIPVLLCAASCVASQSLTLTLSHRHAFGVGRTRTAHRHASPRTSLHTSLHLLRSGPSPCAQGRCEPEGRLSLPALVEIFRAHGVGRPHSYAARDNSADRDKIEKLVASGRQPVLTARDVPPRRKWDECTCCGHVVKRMEFREKTLHSQAGWRAVQSFYTVGAPNFAARYPGPLPGAGVYQGKARKVYKDEDGDDEDDEDEEDDDEDDEDD